MSLYHDSHISVKHFFFNYKFFFTKIFKCGIIQVNNSNIFEGVLVIGALFKRRYLFVFVSGLLFSVPFIFPELCAVSFFSCVPFFMVLFDGLKNRKKNKAIKYTIVFGAGFYLPVYIWFFWMYPMEQTGVTPMQSLLIVVVAWLIFPILQSFVLLILPLGLKFFKKINIFLFPALTAFLYVITEWVQSWFMSGLTWAKLSVAQYKNLYFMQSLSLFGTYFASFVVIFINACFAVYILNKSYKTASIKNNNLLILAAVLLCFFNLYFGYFRIMYYDHVEKSRERQKITAMIIQGNISSYDKWDNIENSFDIYSSLLEENASEDENIDICVFPETAIPISVKQNSPTYNRLHNLAAANDLTLFTGIIYYDDIKDKRYNAILGFDKNYESIPPYGKRHLVPFGEYLPAEQILTTLFPFVSNISLFDSAITPGEGANIMAVGGVGYGGLVCFDSIFPELARKSVLEGADVLIIVTNDSWFRDSPAIYQHNAQAVLRAVENNRYAVRSANTGISSFISPTGKILQESEVLCQEVLTEQIEIVKNKTVYTRFGDIILYLSWLYMIFCIIFRFSKKS